MTKKGIFNLKKILTITRAQGVMVLSSDGKLIDALNIDHEANIAAMIEIVCTMCTDLSTDMNNGDLEQFLIRASSGFIVVNKVSSGHIILLSSDDRSKIGLLLKSLDLLETNLL